MAQNHSDNIANWLKISSAEGVGSVTFARLMKKFKTIDNVMGASVNQMMQIDGIGPKKAEKIAASRNSFNADKELELADDHGVWIINIQDSRYPELLKEIYDPPPVLYIKGTLKEADNLGLAIVGSRRASMYGREQTAKFAHLLASAGFTIYSGMARGIDTVAHHSALAAKGRTVAVQGCGLANVFPSENKKLFEQITESGCCISELPMTYEPLAENFPPRNRIIAGMSLGTLVVEAALRSGALITARVAMESDRQVMAIPGKIDSPMSKGPNKLIKDGAALIDSIDDIVEVIGFVGQRLKKHVAKATTQRQSEVESAKPLHQIKLADHEQKIYALLNKEPIHLDQIIVESNIQPGKVNASMISLRLKSLVRQLPGNFYVRA